MRAWKSSSRGLPALRALWPVLALAVVVGLGGYTLGVATATRRGPVAAHTLPAAAPADTSLAALAAPPPPPPATATPALPTATSPPPAPRALTLPVLEYHDVGVGVGEWQVTLEAFVAQLDWLQDHGYTTVTLAQAYDYLYAGGALPPRPVILTFDDGRASQWDAAHELNARGLVGVFFVQGGGTALSDDQLRQLVAWGHELAAHSMSHPLLTQLSDDELEYEVAGAKAALEATLGVPIAFFAYPFGDYDARVVAAVAAAGYRGALAAWGGAAWTPEQRWEQPRIIVSGDATLADFAALVTSATP